MAPDTRLVIIESDDDLGQFLEESIETLLGEEQDVKVTELDPNSLPEEVFQ